MAKYDVTLDDGRTIRIDVDDNVTPEEASRQAIALAPPLDSTPQQTVTAAPQSPSFGTQVLRGGEALAEGVIDSLAGAAGALPQLTAYAGRQIPVVRDYMPGPGYYPRKIKEAVKGAATKTQRESLRERMGRLLGHRWRAPCLAQAGGLGRRCHLLARRMRLT